MRRRAQPRGPIFGRVARAAGLGAGGMWAYGIALLLTLVATGFTAVCHELGLGDVEFAWFFVSISLASCYGTAPGVFAASWPVS